MRAIVALIGLATTGAANFGPSPVEFAKALVEFTGVSVSITELWRLSCKSIDEEPTEAVCTWRQKVDGKWQRLSTYVAVDGAGWHLIDSPSPMR